MPSVESGLEVLVRRRPALLRGRRVGLLAHQASVDRRLAHAADLLGNLRGVKLVALLAPEHGLWGAPQDHARVAGTRDAATGLPVWSLYGERREPTAAMLRGLDVLVVDLQDVGARYYTYNWTMALAMRVCARVGVRVVVLNHPRNIHSNFQPFAEKNFNPVTGENRRGFEFSFDAVEVVNSSALQSDLMLTFRDWFALLNYGYHVTAVGSSDCHDVSRYIVGQGRSYVMCGDSIAGKINVEEACRGFLKGRVLVSLGLLTQMTVEDKFQVGDLATSLGELMRVTVTVLGPSWTSADRVELYANGVKIREQQIEAPVSPVEKTRVVWIVPKPAYDAYLVAIASGPPVNGPYWPIPKPYQPKSRVWQPRVIGATNPIWVDGDGDGKFTPPRAYAKEIVKRAGSEPKKLIAELAKYDEAVATQVASLCQTAGRDVRSTEFEEALETAVQHVRRGFAAYAATLPSK